MGNCRLIWLLATLLALPLGAVNTPDPGPHPRLLLGAGDEDRVRQAIEAQPILRQADSLILSYCDALLEKPVLERVLVGRRMLNTSREAVKRIFWLGYAWRIHGTQAYADRATKDLADYLAQRGDLFNMIASPDSGANDGA